MSDILWTAKDAAFATSGTIGAEWQATGVSIDTRTMKKGDLFIALKGPNFDGHNFVKAALEAGAAAAMVSEVPADMTDKSCLLMVNDTQEGLEDLGRFARDRAVGKIIAVTGSVGKTGTKEALRNVLGGQGQVSANLGSLNNHWGLPLSLARLPQNADFGIFEMGMNHAGELSVLTRMARPHVAIITTVEAVHSEFFASVEEIADAKAEIFEGLVEGGIAVLNKDNNQFDRLAAAARKVGADIISFGADADAAVKLVSADAAGFGADVVAEVAGEEINYRLSLPGYHWVINSLGILAVVKAADGDVARAAAAMAKLEAPKGRGQRFDITLEVGSFTLIDESYNASPASMTATFKVLGTAPVSGLGRRIAVLGDMLELGEDAADRHAALAEELKINHIDLVFAAGPLMKNLFDALPGEMKGVHARDSETLKDIVASAIEAGDVVVVKGSAGSKTAQIVEALKALNIMTNQEDTFKRAGNGN